MKNLFFLLLASVFCFAFMNAPDKADVTTKTDTYKGIKNANELMDLFHSKVAPMNKLSEAAVLSFKETMVFDEEDRLRGGYVKEIEESLSENEFIQFLELVTQSNIKLDQVARSSGANPVFSYTSVICSNSVPTVCKIGSCDVACTNCCGKFVPHYVCIAPCGSDSY